MAAQDEMMLLERVFLRIGSAETDEQLQVALGKFLTPCLLKLASQTEGVRKKVMELLVHINKRVKSRPKVLLPIQELLTQYQDPSASPFVTNFTILYIKMGYPRMDKERQGELAPKLVQCLDGRPATQQDSLMLLIVQALPYIKFPKDSEAKKGMFGFSEKPQISRLLLDYMLDMLLLPYNISSSSSNQDASQGASQGRPQTPIPPGMSEAAYKRVTGDAPWNPEDLEKTKLGIFAFLCSEVFEEEDVTIHYIVGTADPRHSVANAADRELKKITGSQDWNRTSIIAKLYSLFQGTVVIKGQNTNMKPDQKRSPAGIQLRMKIFPYFLKSREAACQFPACVQVAFDCLYGTNTNAKLKNMAVQFIHHLCLNCPDAKFNPIGGVLLTGMVKFIGECAEDTKLRGLAYVAVGKIARRAPQTVSSDIGLLQRFFDAMSKEESENKLAIQEALSLMADSFKNLDVTKMKLMEALIMQNIEKPEPQARLMAVQYANAVFPSDHIPSRYVLLLACGDLKEDIYAEASKILRKLPKQNESDQEVASRAMPPFQDMVSYINEKSTERIKNSSGKYVIGNHVLAFNPSAYAEILIYLRMCLAYNAGVIPNFESTFSMVEQAPAIAAYVQDLMDSNPSDKGPIHVYIGIMRQLLTAIGGSPAMYCLLEIVAIAREKIAPHFVKSLPWIKNFMFSSKEDMREYASQLYAIVVATAQPPTAHATVITELTGNLQTQALEGQHGSLLALGYLLGLILAGKNPRRNKAQGEAMETDQDNDNKQVNNAMYKAVLAIAAMLDNQHVLLSSGACVALGELGRNGALPLPNESDKKTTVTKLSIVENLVKKLQTTKEHNRLREKAALCLGFLCVGEEEFPHRKKVVEGMLDCAQPKQFELHFTVGEGLVYAAQGATSPASRDLWIEKEDSQVSDKDKDPEEVKTVVDLLLEKYIGSPNPHIRQAAGIWLLSMVRKCGTHSYIQQSLSKIQDAFMRLLGENDEITQDMGSKGLGVVYEICSKEQKDELVSTLVETLMTGKRTQTTVTADTQVFQEGTLGKTPDGQNLSTYKELCSIANDLNQPDLIYKFMHLANHNAAWNTKKGAAFGFSTIAAQAGEQLAPYLHKIVPKLYRYQFDPNPKIQMAMTSIWSALVSDNKKTVDKYLQEIMSDLISNLTSNQWRVRESSCLALNDLLRGRSLDDVVNKLAEVWETMFRVRDDIKESVRNAAELTCKTLSRVSIKICDPAFGKAGEQATSVVLPCLLKTGLGSPVKEVRALSLATILKIAKTAGPLLKPNVPLLVTALLESLSGLEPQYLNYVSLHVASDRTTQDRLDSARIAASKSSPMMEVINLSVQYVDGLILGELVPRLTELIRSGIGIGTKAGCSSFIISLTHQCPKEELAPYAGKLLSALLNGLNDRNSTVKRSYASAIGHLVKIAKDSSVEKLIQRLREWYLEKEEQSVRQACGLTLHAISQRSPDVLKRHAAVALPLAFLAMHEKLDEEDKEKTNEVVNTVWEEVWLDGTPGTEAGVRLYLVELVEITQIALDNQSWRMKAQGASSMSTIATKQGANLGPPHLGLLLSTLLKGLSGRTWTGKEALLEAVSTVSVSCREALKTPQENQPTMDEVVETVMKECRKEKIVYKMEALKAIGAILEANEIDQFKEISEILFPMLSKESKKSGKKDEDDDDINKDTWIDFQCIAYETLGQAWPKVRETQDSFVAPFLNLLSKNQIQSVWKVELSILKTLYKVLQRLHVFQSQKLMDANKENVSTMIQDLTAPLCKSLGNVKYVAIRTEAIGVTQFLITKLEDCERLELLPGEEAKTLSSSLEVMSKDSQPDLKDKAIELNKKLSRQSLS